jgi:hypothetical protein
MEYQKVTDLTHLNKLIEEEKHEFFIALNGGIRSDKAIFFGDEEGTYFIINYIDDSEQTLTKDELFNKDLTNIGYALSVGSLYSFGF